MRHVLHVSSQALTLRNTQIMSTAWWSCGHNLPPPQPDVRKMAATLCLERWFCSMKMERWIYEGTLMAVWDILTGSVTVELAFLEQEANHPLCTKFVISQWQLIVHFYIWKKKYSSFSTIRCWGQISYLPRPEVTFSFSCLQLAQLQSQLLYS